MIDARARVCLCCGVLLCMPCVGWASPPHTHTHACMCIGETDAHRSGRGGGGENAVPTADKTQEQQGEGGLERRGDVVCMYADM